MPAAPPRGAPGPGPGAGATLPADAVFERLRGYVRTHVHYGKERPALSCHTSNDCQKKKTGGPTTNLKACGLDERIQDGYGYRVHLKLPNLIRPEDGLSIEYTGPACRTFPDDWVA